MKRKTTDRFSIASREGFTLMEVLVAMTILLTGILAVAAFFPRVLDANARSADQSIAAFLAQMKAEEIRRDYTDTAVDAIKLLSTPTDPVTFGHDQRFAYRLNGETVLYANDPSVTTGVARVLIVYPDSPDQPIYELAFDK